MNSVDNKNLTLFTLVFHNFRKYTSNEKILKTLSEFQDALKKGYINSTLGVNVIYECDQLLKKSDPEIRDQIEIVKAVVDSICEYKRCYGY